MAKEKNIPEEKLKKVQALYAAKLEQYTMNILNGMLAGIAKDLILDDSEDGPVFRMDDAKFLVDEAYQLARYQISKIYKEVSDKI